MQVKFMKLKSEVNSTPLLQLPIHLRWLDRGGDIGGAGGA